MESKQPLSFYSATANIKVTPPLVFKERCKQINNSNLRYMSDIISLLFMREITRFHRCHASYSGRPFYSEEYRERG